MKKLFFVMAAILAVTICANAEDIVTDPTIQKKNTIYLSAGEEGTVEMRMDNLTGSVEDFSMMYLVKDLSSIKKVISKSDTYYTFGDMYDQLNQSPYNYNQVYINPASTDELFQDLVCEGFPVSFSATYNNVNATKVLSSLYIKYTQGAEQIWEGNVVDYFYIVIENEDPDAELLAFPVQVSLRKVKNHIARAIQIQGNVGTTVRYDAEKIANEMGISLSAFQRLFFIKDLSKLRYNSYNSIDFGISYDPTGLPTADYNYSELYIGDGMVQSGTAKDIEGFPVSILTELNETETLIHSLDFIFQCDEAEGTQDFYIAIDDPNYNYDLYVFPITLTTLPENMQQAELQICQTIFLKAAQGEKISVDISDVLASEGHEMSTISGQTALFVYELSNIDQAKLAQGELGYLGDDNGELFTIGGILPSYTKFPVDITYDDSGNTPKVFVKYQGLNSNDIKEFFLIMTSSSGGDAVEVYPIRAETYNSFQTIEYPAVSNANLDKFLYESGESFYLAKDLGGGQINIVNEAIEISANGIFVEDNNTMVELFKMFKADEKTIGLPFFVKYVKGGYRLCDKKGEVYYLVDHSQGGTVSYGIYKSADDVILQDYNNFLTVQPLNDDASAVIKAQWNDICLYLDYNTTNQTFTLTDNIAEDDEAHKLALYKLEVTADQSPFFMPYNGQVTTINAADQNSDDTPEGAVNPLTIEITFDRDLATVVNTTTGKTEVASLVNGELVPLSLSGLLEITIDDGTDPALKNLRPRRPRPVLVNSTNVKSEAPNVAVISLNPEAFSSTAASSAPERENMNSPRRNYLEDDIWLRPRPVLVNSTNVSVNVSAQSGAIAFAQQVQNKPRRSSAEYQSSSPFGFEYYVNMDEKTPEEIANLISNGSKVEIDLGENNIGTYYTESLDANSTEQLRFFKVSQVQEGVIVLKRLRGVVRGPMMVMKIDESLNHAVAVEKGSMSSTPVGNYLNYCRRNVDVSDMNFIPYYYQGYYDGSLPEDIEEGYNNNLPAYNYIFGKKKNGADWGELGFYYLNISMPGPNDYPQGWINTRDADIVYLHSNKNLAPSNQSSPVRIVLEDGTNVGETTAIYEISNNKTTSGNFKGKRYNVMGQFVDDNYRGIIIFNGKKSINK